MKKRNTNKKVVLLTAILLVLSIIFFISLLIPSSFAQTQNTQNKGKDVCAIYFTGIGCPHCAKTDPIIIGALKEYPNFVVIEYEIYQQQENGHLILDYNSKYETGLGIPLIIFENRHKVGDSPIIENINSMIENGSSKCVLLNNSVDFNELDINGLPGKPKIWTKDRILIKESENNGNNNQLLIDLLTKDNLSDVLKNQNYNIVEPEKVALSGRSIEFENAIKLNGWIFQWNGQSIGSETSKCSCPSPGGWSACVNQTKSRTDYKCSNDTGYKCIAYTETAECNNREKITMAKLISLAAVDAINPCALAVLVLMLVAILTYNPKKKKNILLAGLAFTTSVFVMYLFYGLVIIKFFQIIQILTSVKLWLYKALGIGAIILGILNIKDFIKYRPGGPCTEMPMTMRPKVQRLISKITSPRGAFGVGIFVTIFLLPCTIGPYVIAGGILSALELIKTIPPLLLYNIVFVIPMLVITLLVYSGFSKVEDVSGWREKNIKKLHLISGIIMLALGIAMAIGLI